MYSDNYGTRGGFSTDLACERRRADTELPGVDFRREVTGGGVWERITISSEVGARSIGRPMGHYDTLNLPRMDTLDYDGIEDAREEVASQLCLMCERLDIFPERILVVGLGNRELTPDSLGPRCAMRVDATRHIRDEDEDAFLGLECSEISVLCPGVSSSTGISSQDAVKGICQVVKPSLIIAIDAIAARSPKRLGTTVQFSDTGIFPGSGLGNHSYPINQRILGAPVVAIGVPTVIDASRFSERTSDSSEYAGMFVSPKEIDGIVRASAAIIGGGINQAFGIDL